MGKEAAVAYFRTFVEIGPGIWARHDVYDIGSEYRALIGLPGGLAGPYGSTLGKANYHNMTLVAGAGSDPDTLGYNRVYVMDSDEYPAYQAELCMQMRDDTIEKYDAGYHALNESLLASGCIADTGCPR